ncbi:RNA polymerase sigma factor [Agromyces sp. NPDC055661]
MTAQQNATEANSTANTQTDFAALLREMTPELLRYFVRRVQDSEDSADCLAETLLAAWRRIDDLPIRHEDRRAWIYGIARLVAANQRRGNARRRALLEQLAGHLLVDQRTSEAIEDVDALDALRRLSSTDRELVQLVVWESLTLVEAAFALGISPAAARKRYSRARARLRSSLENGDSSGSDA